MRILLTTDTIGGVWTFNKELASYLLLHGHSVALAIVGPAPSPKQTQWCTAKAELSPTRFRFEVFSVALEWMQDNALSYCSAEEALLRLIGYFQPDLIHISQFCFGALPVDIPKVVTAHSDVLSWASACRPQGLDSSDWLTQYRALVQEGLNGCDVLVAPTEWMLHELARQFVLPEKKLAVHNGMTFPHSAEPSLRMLQAITVGRLWDEAKNLILLTQLEATLPILAAGESTHEVASIPPAVGSLTMLGRLEEEELIALFRESSIYIAPSIYEPFGLAPLEAALCGCAVLLNDIPSFREVWGDAALYFAGGVSLQSELDRLANSPKQLERTRSRAYRRAIQLTTSRSADKYLAIYTSLLASATSASIEELAIHAC